MTHTSTEVRALEMFVGPKTEERYMERSSFFRGRLKKMGGKYAPCESTFPPFF